MSSSDNITIFLPLLTLLIFGLIVFFIAKKSKTVQLRGYDYLWFNNFQAKLQKKARRLNLNKKFYSLQKTYRGLSEKFLLKMRIEALRVQVWADKKLEKAKNNKSETAGTNETNKLTN